MLPDRREGLPPVASPKAPESGANGRQVAPAPPNRPPPFAFFKGVALGLVVVIPAIAATVWALTKVGVIGRSVTMVEAIRMTTLFTGVAAVLTAGGIGRLAAFASTTPGGRRAAVIQAARVQAIAGAGLTLIAAIPFGHLPSRVIAWLWIGAAGALTGAVAGAVIGYVCGMPRADRAIPDLLRRVPALAEWARQAKLDPRVLAQAQRARQAKLERAPSAVAPPPPPVEAVAPPVDAVAPVLEPSAPLVEAVVEPVLAPEPSLPGKMVQRVEMIAEPPPPGGEPGVHGRHEDTPLPVPMPLGVDTTTRGVGGTPRKPDGHGG